MTKNCRVCGDELSESNTYRPETQQILGNICKQCHRDNHRIYYRENRVIRPRLYHDANWLFERHHKDGWSISKMARVARGTSQTIKSKMEEFNIEILDFHCIRSVGHMDRKYCSKFNHSLKEEIRDLFDRRCFICGKIENGRRLSVHHVDYNKNTLCNGKMWGLIPLCGSCHTRTNWNRWYWFGLLGNYYALNDSIQFIYPDFFSECYI